MSKIPNSIHQTTMMLRWFDSHGVNRWDLALRLSRGAFITRGSADLDSDALQRRLAWARWANARGAEIYVRPARNRTWPMLFLDDVAPSIAQRIANKYAALLLRTSIQGGCHLWLHLSCPLDEQERHLAQAFLQPLVGADPASTSGEHWGRLAGTRNHKRDGQWMSLLAATTNPAWDPTPALSPPKRGGRVASSISISTKHDRDESVAEFSWCCHCLKNGIHPQLIVTRLAQRAHTRGKRKPWDYAKRTVLAAMGRLDAPP